MIRNDTRDKARAVLLAAIMVISIFGGSMALAGSAAAAVNNITGQTAENVEIGQATTTQDVTFQTAIDGASATETYTLDIDSTNVDPGNVSITDTDTSDISIGGSDSGAVSATDVTDNTGSDGTIDITITDDSQDDTVHQFTITATLEHTTDGISTTTSADSDTYTLSDGSGTSGDVSFALEDTTPPTTPGSPGATAVSNGDIEVSFDAATDSGTGVDSYSVKRATSSGGAFSEIDTVSEDGSSSYTYTDTTASDGTTYYYVITAVDGASNEGSQSSEVSATSDATPPSFDTDYPSTANVVSNGFDLNVQANEDGTAHYVVLADGATAPSAQQVIDGQDNNGDSGVTSGDTAITSGQEATLDVTELSANTQYDVYAVAEDSAGNTNSPALVEVETTNFQSASITANPDGTGQSANHTVTWTLGSQTDVQTYEIDYSDVDAHSADISNVGPEDIARLGLDTDTDDEIETDLTDAGETTSVNSVNGGDGTVLTVTTSSSVTIDQGTQVILEYSDAVNPTQDTDVALRLDPDTPDVDVTRTLAVGSTSAPTVSDVSIGGTSVSDSGIYSENVNGTDQTLAISFNKDMDQDVTPTTSLTVDGEDVSINEGSWSDASTWEGTVDVNVSNEEVDATTTVSDATGTDGNSLASEDTRTFEIDTAPLGIVSATTDENSGTADRIDVTLNDTYSSETTDDFSVTDDNDESVTVSGINNNGDEDATTLELELGAELAANATPNVTLESGQSIQDDAGNGVDSAQEIEAADGVAPTVSSFDLAQEDGRTLNVSLDADEQLDDFTVTINDTEDGRIDADDPSVTTLNESDFDESVSDGTYNYTTNYTLSSDGTYFASIESAADAADNDDVDQTTGTVQIDQSGPSISPNSPEDNAIVTSQQDITATIEDDGVGVNSGDIYVTLEDSEGELIDRGRVGGVSGLDYTEGTLTIQAENGDAFAFAEGDVNVTVEATDTNGEETTESWSFTYTTVSVNEFAADGDEVAVNISTATEFDNVNATVESTQSLANEDGVVSDTVDLTADGDYYTGTFTAPRDGEYNLNEVVVANAEGKTASPNPGDATVVNTTKPQVSNAYISGYDGTDTTITVQFNEPVDGPSTILDTETFSVEGEDIAEASTTGDELAAGEVTLRIGSAVQTGDEPNISVNTASDVNQLYGSNNGADESVNTTLHTIQLSLSEGTNFVSVPAAAGTVDVTEYDDNVDVVWTYDEGSWESYDPDKSAENNDFTALEGGQGYVFEMDNADTLDVNAYNVVGGDTQAAGTPGQQQLEEGWNLVGHWQEGSQASGSVAGEALYSLDNYDGSRIYTQSGSAYSYSELGESDFTPGESYWVFVSDDDVYKETSLTLAA